MSKFEKPETKDQVFNEMWQPKDFKFDTEVASVFDDMVSRSVPFYSETKSTALNLAKSFVKPKSNIYDIGCSTATMLIDFAKLIDDKSVNFIGVDNSQPMINKAFEKVKSNHLQDRICLQLNNVEDNMKLSNASVVFMTYTLQFVRPLCRDLLIKQIYDSLLPNGCLILVEKILGNDSLFNRLYIDLYYEYKRSAGYSNEEIQNKREALENVMIPYRIDENIELLKRNGFSSYEIFFKWFNWAGIIVTKS